MKDGNLYENTKDAKGTLIQLQFAVTCLQCNKKYKMLEITEHVVVQKQH